jgi:hypothetical protein
MNAWDAVRAESGLLEDTCGWITWPVDIVTITFLASTGPSLIIVIVIGTLEAPGESVGEVMVLSRAPRFDRLGFGGCG